MSTYWGNIQTSLSNPHPGLYFFQKLKTVHIPHTSGAFRPGLENLILGYIFSRTKKSLGTTLWGGTFRPVSAILILRYIFSKPKESPCSTHYGSIQTCLSNPHPGLYFFQKIVRVHIPYTGGAFSPVLAILFLGYFFSKTKESPYSTHWGSI